MADPSDFLLIFPGISRRTKKRAGQATCPSILKSEFYCCKLLIIGKQIVVAVEGVEKPYGIAQTERGIDLGVDDPNFHRSDISGQFRIQNINLCSCTRIVINCIAITSINYA